MGMVINNVFGFLCGLNMMAFSIFLLLSCTGFKNEFTENLKALSALAAFFLGMMAVLTMIGVFLFFFIMKIMGRDVL